MAYNRQSSKTYNHDKGNKGEDVACKFLVNKGFAITDRNYSRAWGEIDIIGRKDNIVHFFEVKSVTTTYTDAQNGHKPEENVHNFKIRHIRRMVETYLEEKCNGFETDFSFHVLCVFLNMQTRRAKVEWINDLIL